MKNKYSSLWSSRPTRSCEGGPFARILKNMRKLQNLAEKAEITLPTLSTIEHQERFNTFSHFVAAGFALCGCSLLLVLSLAKGDWTRFLTFAIYSITTVSLYCFSSLYHGSSGAAKDFYRQLDHVGIFLKIAGNYTPYAVLVLHGSSSWITLVTVWGLAGFGIFQELFLNMKTRRLSYILYALTSATITPFISELYHGIPPMGFFIIMAGFVSYVIGAYFFFNDKRYKHGHEIWHVGVVCGSLCHYLPLLLYVA